MDTTVQLHPKALEAQRRAEMKKDFRMKALLQIKSAREQGACFYADNVYTICYRKDKHNVYEFSTTLRHPKEKHDSCLGKYEALKRFAAGNRVLVRIPKHLTPKQFFEFTLTNYSEKV